MLSQVKYCQLFIYLLIKKTFRLMKPIHHESHWAFIVRNIFKIKAKIAIRKVWSYRLASGYLWGSWVSAALIVVTGHLLTSEGQFNDTLLNLRKLQNLRRSRGAKRFAITTEQRHQQLTLPHAALLRLLACHYSPHGDIRLRWSFQVMERLETQSAQPRDLRAAIFMPELQSVTDTDPHASVKAKTCIRQAARLL